MTQARPQGVLARTFTTPGTPRAKSTMIGKTSSRLRGITSNASYRALGAATAAAREHGHLRPPDALRSAAYPGARKLGRGKGYVYPHDDPAGFEVDNLPDELKGTVFYEPSGSGEETERPRGSG